MQVRYRLFKSVMKSWEDLCADAAAFASTIGRERLINISQADTGGQDVIFVWYWVMSTWRGPF